MKIFDCFMYFDEEIVLDLRLNTLNEYVDYFIIVESSFTHKGDKRKLKFNHDKFSKFKDKIIYIVYDEEPKNIETIYENDNEEKNPNVVKVLVENEIKNKSFAKAVDFFRVSNRPLNKLAYHHVGIYAFTNKALIRYVSLDRSKLEKNRKLEQLRALEDKMKIDVGYIDTCPLSVDTEADLVAVKKVMEK